MLEHNLPLPFSYFMMENRKNFDDLIKGEVLNVFFFVVASRRRRRRRRRCRRVPKSTKTIFF
jgi:hypothetical protein